MEVLQVFFLQDLHDLIFQDNSFSCKVITKLFISCKESFIFSVRLARCMQDLMQDLAVLQEENLQDLHISCKMVFSRHDQLL